MKYYLAPLEGVTTYVYRNAYHKYFRKMDKYFTPFIVPHKDKKFSTRELKELSPEHNEGLVVIPQLLTNNSEDFLKTAKDIKALGYDEINLNFGCPSKTVVTKKKGSGFLAFPDELDRFLEEVFEKTDMKISVKTRIGKENPDEFYRILEIYNKYPIEELTIHPRVQTDYYNNTPNWDMFEVAYKESKNPICYNGDIHSKEDYERFYLRFSEAKALMLGRGIIKNPALVSNIESGLKLSKDNLYGFHQMVLEEYIKISSGDRNVLFKMKELWFYMISLFEDAEKHAKKIKKTERLKEYENIISTLFETCALRED
ncbi:MAG: tRNA-dihydrouridine synthase family protein [Tyzzerella sp.]|nr:tRNA-dihydrouridine synthase family protein [Tyzzerella sp.]